MFGVVVGASVWWWRQARPVPELARAESLQAHARSGKPAMGNQHDGSRATAAAATDETGATDAESAAPQEARALSAAEKAARVAKIKRDYDDIRAKAAADYTAAGASFPGGLNAFLRQLALLEREKRADFAAVLDAAELEELEYRETTAGQLVQRLLGDTAASEEQRRAVFRLQLAFEDRFALTFDLSPRALLERETLRQQVQEQIRGVLGDALLGSWLRGEGGDFGNFTRFVAEQGLPLAKAIELWQVKNEFIRRRLELNSQPLPAEQLRALQGALTQETESRAKGILGPGAAHAASRDVLGWLPGK